MEEFDEELFLKNNEDYEQRLKEHLYLFEEKQPKEEEQMAQTIHSTERSHLEEEEHEHSRSRE